MEPLRRENLMLFRRKEVMVIDVNRISQIQTDISNKVLAFSRTFSYIFIANTSCVLF